MRCALCLFAVSLVACGKSAAEYTAQGMASYEAWARDLDETNYRLAERAFYEAVHLEPNNARYHLNLGTLYANARCYEQALPPLKEAARLNPSDPDIRNNLEFVEVALSNKQSECFTVRLSERDQP